MIDALQILLAAVIASLTVVLIIIGIEFWLILKEMKKSITKMNAIIDDTQVVTKAVAETVEDARGFLSGLKHGAGLIKAVKKLAKNINEEKD